MQILLFKMIFFLAFATMNFSSLYDVRNYPLPQPTFEWNFETPNSKEGLEGKNEIQYKYTHIKKKKIHLK